MCPKIWHRLKVIFDGFRHPWTDKGRTENILTARLIDDVLSNEPLPSPVLNESIIDAIVSTVGGQPGCDDLTRHVFQIWWAYVLLFN